MDRLAARVAQSGALSMAEAYRQIAHNIDLFVHVRLVDHSWRGGSRQRYVSEIRQVVGAIENDRPVTHLAYSAAPSGGQPAGFFPDAAFEAELGRFRRALPTAAAPTGGVR